VDQPRLDVIRPSVLHHLLLLLVLVVLVVVL